MDELDKIKTEATAVKGWFERYLNWLIAGGCFALGVITAVVALAGRHV